jgi:lysophospholipase L1-like esterase
MSKSLLSLEAIQPQAKPMVVDTLVDEQDGSITDGDISLRDAIAFLGERGTINFAPGLSGTITLDPELGPVLIDKSLTLESPGADLITIGANNQFRVIVVDDNDSDFQSDVFIRGLGITQGRGGVLNRENLTIDDSVITNNKAVEGGGIENFGDLRLLNSTVSNNIAEEDGAGIWNVGNLRVENSTISGNASETEQGGGLYHLGDQMTVLNSTVSGNQASGAAGILNGGGSIAAISNSTIHNNRSFSDSGGIRNVGDLIISNSIVAGNTAANNDGPDVTGTYQILRIEAENMNLTNYEKESRDFASLGDLIALEAVKDATNSSETEGSATYNFGGPTGFYKVKVAFFDESDGQGKAEFSVKNTQQVEEWFFDQDLPGTRASAKNAQVKYLSKEFLLKEGDEFELKGIKDPFSQGYAQQRERMRFDYVEFIPSDGFNLIGISDGSRGFSDGVKGDIVGTSSNPVVPKLGPLQDNGGPTLTHALLPSSPAIDAGNPNFTSPPKFGQRGDDFPRVVDGDGNGIKRLDIGSFEFKIRIMPVGDSHTVGYQSANPKYEGGYRYELQRLLHERGIDYDFVGSEDNGPPENKSGDFDGDGKSDYDDDHEGHGGQWIKYFAETDSEGKSKVVQWIEAEHPDFVLLMVGTNDILNDQPFGTTWSQLQGLLENIKEKAPEQKVLVSGIPPMNGDGSHKSIDNDDVVRVKNFNKILKNEFGNIQSTNIIYVDAATGLNSDIGGHLLIDGVHLSEAGHTELGKAWYNALMDQLTGVHPLAGTDSSDQLIGTGISNILTGHNDDLMRANPAALVGANEHESLLASAATDQFFLGDRDNLDGVTAENDVLGQLADQSIAKDIGQLYEVTGVSDNNAMRQGAEGYLPLGGSDELIAMLNTTSGLEMASPDVEYV